MKQPGDSGKKTVNAFDLNDIESIYRDSGYVRPPEDRRREKVYGEQRQQQANREILIQKIRDKEQEYVNRMLPIIRQQLQELENAISNVTAELDKVINENLVNPGIHHLNFLEKIRSFLLLLKKNAEWGLNWLEIFNDRKKRRNFYKVHIMGSGTKSSLSKERHLATATG